MNIVITVTNDIRNDRRMLKTAKTLFENKYHVLIIGFNRFNTTCNYHYANTKLLPLWFKKGKLSYIEIQIRLFLYLIFKKYEKHIAVDMDTLPVSFLLLKLKPNTKLIFDAHEWFSEVPELQQRAFTKSIWKYLEQILIPKVKTKYTVSQSIAEEFEQLGYGNFKLIRNVPYKVNEPLKSNFESKIIIYQGSINMGRGLDLLLETLVYFPYKLWIVGNGDEMLQLKEKIEILNLTKQVTVYGMLPPNELFTLTSKATVGYNVLEPKGKNYEYSLANKFFDYIQAGIPTITNNFIEYKRINNEYEVAYLVNDYTIESLCKGIERMMNNQMYYEKLRTNCIKAKEKLHWENESKKLIEIINHAN